MFENWLTNVHIDKQSAWPCIVSDYHVWSEKQCFKIPEISGAFSQISHTVLYVIFIAGVDYQKSCAKQVLKHLTNAKNGLGFGFSSEQYCKDSYEFLSHHTTSR
jgi:hypothetical protein